MKKNEGIKKNLFAFLLSALGTAFLIYYIFRASADVISSDYIRIVDYYLDNVRDIHYLTSWESITRVPITFLCRFINKEFFAYSVFFDKIIGTFGLFLFNFITVKFLLNILKSKEIKIIASVIVTIISFSLMPWEMILNGTGYPHFMTIGLIALVFYLFDRIVKRTKAIMTFENIDSSDLKYYGNEKENNRLGNMMALIDTSQMQRKNISAHLFVYLLTAATSLIFAGSYCVGFLCTLIFFSIIEIFVFIALRNKFNKGEIDSFDSDKELYEDFKEQYNNQEIKSFGKFKGEKYSTVNNESTFKIFFKFLILIIISLLCMYAYFNSSNIAGPLVPVGMKEVTLIEVLKEDPIFPIRYMLKSLASAIIGVETFNYAINFGTITEKMIYFVGILYVFILLVTFIVVIIRLFNKNKVNVNIFDINSYRNIFPFMYVILGLGNFAIIFLARYKFIRDDYGMTSRYGLQYMFLTIGVIMILSLFVDDVIYNKRYYKVDKKKSLLSKGYLKRKEKLIMEGKIKPEIPKISPFYVTMTILCVICACVLTFGHIITTIDEIFKADYRKIVYNNLVDIAKNYENYTDEELENSFEYHRDVNQIKHALSTLKDQKLNVFREIKEIKGTEDLISEK